MQVIHRDEIFCAIRNFHGRLGLTMVEGFCMPDQTESFYDRAWSNWGDMIDHSPAPRHRRRIIRNYVRKIAAEIDSLADVGCGNGTLLFELAREYGSKKSMTGFDVSPAVIAENRSRFSKENIRWEVLNLETQALAGKFDLLICSEVLEHLSDWQGALAKLLEGARKHLVISIPSGPVYPIDQSVGHYRHFDRNMVEDYLKSLGGLDARIEFWGFPFHMLYKRLINLRPGAVYRDFAQKIFGRKEKLVSAMLNVLFFLNLKTHWQTNQMFVYIRK